jgi:hypothetical protein
MLSIVLILKQYYILNSFISSSRMAESLNTPHISPCLFTVRDLLGHNIVHDKRSLKEKKIIFSLNNYNGSNIFSINNIMFRLTGPYINLYDFYVVSIRI